MGWTTIAKIGLFLKISPARSYISFVKKESHFNQHARFVRGRVGRVSSLIFVSTTRISLQIHSVSFMRGTMKKIIVQNVICEKVSS